MLHGTYDEERELTRPFLPLDTPPEMIQGLGPEALLEALDSKLNELTEQRYRLSRRICALKRGRNNVAAPIHRLPPEIMTEIFMIASEWGVHFVNLLKVTHVCAHWRNLALHTPRLWTTVPLPLRHIAELFLARSQPLRVACWLNQLPPAPPSPAQYDLEPLLPAARLQHLHAALSRLDDMDYFIHVLTEPAPHLETLSLEVGREAGWAARVRPVKGALLADTAPKLQTLSLKGVEIPFTSALLTNLVVVKLLSQWSDVPSVDTFLDLLERCPHLEVLDYHCNKFDVDDPQIYPGPPPSRVQPLSCAKLHCFTLNWQPCAWLALVLSKLKLESGTQVHLAGCVLGADEPLVLLPANLDAGYIPALSHILSLHIHDTNSGRLRLDLRPQITQSCREALGSVELDLVVRTNSAAYRDIFTRLSLDHLLELVIEGPRQHIFGLRHPEWVFCLQRVPNLVHLRLMDLSPESAAHLLSDACLVGPDVVNHFKYLETVELVRVDYCVELGDALVDLVCRLRGEHPVSVKLRDHDCMPYPPAALERLKSVVRNTNVRFVDESDVE